MARYGFNTYLEKRPATIGRGIVQATMASGVLKTCARTSTYAHKLIIDGEDYLYIGFDKSLVIEPGDTVAFRYIERGGVREICRTSLARVIDPESLCDPTLVGSLA